jgi:hypothetical protein
MFENHGFNLTLAAAAMAFSLSAAAEDLALEPCVNGAVSPSGTYATAALERAANGYHTWSDFAPYYLFAVSANYLESPFDAAAGDGADTAAAN